MTRLGVNVHGFSLPEVLVSTFFVGFFGLMLHEFHRTVLKSVRTQEEVAQAQLAARVAIEMMSHELRVSGYSGAGQPLVGLRVATPQRIDIQADLTGDGDTDDANEVVSYRYDSSREALMRATGGAAPQPMVERVPAGLFTLRYRDQAGGELTGDLDATARGRVRAIEITLGVVCITTDPALPTARVIVETGRIQLRNPAS